MSRNSHLTVDNAAPSTIGSSVIPILNKLQDILSPFGGELSQVSLPQVAVVGSQSSGKSSVLEALVGRDFLPRGCDICTRCPLVLMLENRKTRGCSEDSDGGAGEWGEFRHLPGQRFYDFSKIRSEIQVETGREAGFNKGVSDKQIRLKISSPNLLNMTLIDLPGITKVPVGDQPSDIEARIRKMIMTYISQENCIILAVSAANSDLATSDALQMAKAADPSGSRTIGVITKLDIMDRGTNACNFLLGKVVPLRLGYVGVVNRSQEDINHNRSIKEALASEENFFRNNPAYRSLSDHCGISQLAKKLNQILEQHVRMVLPKLKTDLKLRLLSVEKELQTYGEDIESKVKKSMVILNIIARYCEAFTAMLDGSSHEMTTKELYGGARIRYIFQSLFSKCLQGVDPCDDLSDDDIRTAIQNSCGPRISLFVPEAPFEVLIKRQLARLEDPSLQCLSFVHDELIKIGRMCAASELQRFPNLRRRLNEIMEKLLLDDVKPARSMIENIIEMEMGYINSANPDFISGDKALELAKEQLRLSQDSIDVEKVPTSEEGPGLPDVQPNPMVNGAVPDQGSHPQSNINRSFGVTGSILPTRSWSFSVFGSRSSSKENSSKENSAGNSAENSASRTEQGTLHNSVPSPSKIQLEEPPSIIRAIDLTENEALEIHVTKLLMRSYFDIVKKSILDQVPKAIMHFLVNHTKRKLHNTFIDEIYREELFEELLEEEEGIVTKRKNAQELHKVLHQATAALSRGLIADA